MKNLTFIDYIFYIFVGIFGIISIYEIIQFVSPHYSFFRASIIFISIIGAYIIAKKGGRSFLTSNMSISELRSDSLKNIYVSKIISYIQKYKNFMVYGAFIVTGILIIFSMIFDTGILLHFFVILFFIIFFVSKLLGFQFDYTIVKSLYSNQNTFRFFLITLGFYIMILTLILNSFGVNEGERGFWYLVFGILYTFAGAGIFIKWDFKNSNFFTPYKLMSAVLITSLFGLLAFQNGLFQVETPEAQNALFSEQQDFDNDFSDSVGREDLFENEEQNQLGINGQEFPFIGQNTGDIAPETEVVFETRQVAQEYLIEPGIQLGSSGQNVQNLQTVLGKLQYYTGEISGEFDEQTQNALIETLKGECSWPESTRGIFGPQAKACVDNLEILVAVN